MNKQIAVNALQSATEQALLDVQASVLHMLQNRSAETYYQHAQALRHTLTYASTEYVFNAVKRHVQRTTAQRVSMKQSISVLRSDIRAAMRADKYSLFAH